MTTPINHTSALSVTQPPWEPPAGTAARLLHDWTLSGAYHDTVSHHHSPAIDALEAHFGMSGQSWCAMFATWAFHVAANGAETLMPLTAGSQNLLAILKAMGLVSASFEALHGWRGALLIRTDPGGEHGHVATVTQRWLDGDGKIVKLSTIEGNSNNDGSANGNGAYFHERTTSSLQPHNGTVWHVADTSSFPGGQWWPEAA